MNAIALALVLGIFLLILGVLVLKTIVGAVAGVAVYLVGIVIILAILGRLVRPRGDDA